jgi:putative MATE family efflux protein
MRVFGVLAVGCNFAFRGYWNATDRSALYLRTLLMMHAVNIFLNWVFIFGNLGAPALGTTGAGLASTISTWVGTAYYFVLGWKHARSEGFLRGQPDRSTLVTMGRLALPNGLQQFLFAGGYLVLFWILGLIGVEATAAANVVINVMLVMILPAIGLGIAAGSLVGQALGRGDASDARRWGDDVVKVSVVLLVSISLPIVLFPDSLLRLFVDDDMTVLLARLPLRIFAGTIVLDAVGHVLQYAMLGAGASRQIMVWTSGLQWGLFLPLAFVVGPMLGFGVLGIWIVHALYRAAQALSFAALWRQSRWAGIAL